MRVSDDEVIRDYSEYEFATHLKQRAKYRNKGIAPDDIQDAIEIGEMMPANNPHERKMVLPKEKHPTRTMEVACIIDAIDMVIETIYLNNEPDPWER